MVVEDEVLLIDNANKPGALAELARALGKAGVNIEYLYCATAPKSRKGLLVRHQLVELGGYLGLFLEDTLVLVNLDVVRRLVAHALRL